MSYHPYKEYVEKYHAAFGTKKMYVVAYMSLHSGELFQYPQYASTDVEAANQVLDTEFQDMELIYDYCANTDSWISVLEINNTLTE